MGSYSEALEYAAKYEIAKRMYKSHHFSLDEISNLADLDMKSVKEMAEEMDEERKSDVYKSGYHAAQQDIAKRLIIRDCGELSDKTISNITGLKESEIPDLREKVYGDKCFHRGQLSSLAGFVHDGLITFEQGAERAKEMGVEDFKSLLDSYDPKTRKVGGE